MLGGETGLFGVFFTTNFENALRTWPNGSLGESGLQAISESDPNAYIGLELAMSIAALNEISEVWITKRFLGSTSFSNTMARNRFQEIRSHLKPHPPNVATDAKMANDPLWHSRTQLKHMQKKFARIAVPFGASSLDENRIRPKARSKAKSFMPSKPDKYALRFYAVVGWKSLYVHSIWDNRSGNSSTTTPPERYTATFPDLRTPLRNTINHPNAHVADGSPTALWVAMMGHQTRARVSPTGRRLMITDNFYTRHYLAGALKHFSDEETNLLGTVRLNLADRWNKVELTAAVERVAQMERGEWVLVAAVEPLPGWQGREAEHKRRQRHLPKESKPTYIGPVSIIVNSGYVILKDRRVVIFYTNDLHDTDPARWLPSSDSRAVTCCHGLYPIKRWTGNEILNRRTFMVPAIIGGYNLAMNAVDRVDQLRSTNPTRRKEARLSMSIFTWPLDLCIINACALYREVRPEESRDIGLREFKRRIAESLTEKELNRRRNSRPQSVSVVATVGADTSHHILTPNTTENSSEQLLCMLCSMRGKRIRARWGCTECGRGFHVECFAALHFRDVFTAATPSVRHALDIVASAAAG